MVFKIYQGNEAMIKLIDFCKVKMQYLKTMFKKIIIKIFSLENELFDILERRRQIRNLRKKLNEFDKQMTPIIEQGHHKNYDEIQNYKSSGAFALWQIAKKQQELLERK